MDADEELAVTGPTEKRSCQEHSKSVEEFGEFDFEVKVIHSLNFHFEDFQIFLKEYENTVPPWALLIELDAPHVSLCSHAT